MTTRLLLVDYENVHRVDLSPFDESYSANVFLGAGQNAPKALTNKRTAHQFERVAFCKVLGRGKNALDFHIAFQLGRVFETAPKTVCFVVSRDKGFDPLMAQVNRMGLSCRCRYPRRALSILATSIFFIPIIASNARFASAPPAAIASVNTRGGVTRIACHQAISSIEDAPPNAQNRASFPRRR